MGSESSPCPGLIHVGYHKCASSFLQDRVFGNPRAGFEQPWSLLEITEQFVLPHSFGFDPERARDYFAPALEAAQSRGCRAVLSCEHLSGRATPAAHRSKEVAGRLARTFPGARVLIVIREQRSAILSWYREVTRSGNNLSMKRFLAPAAPGFDPTLDRDYFEFHRLIQHYQDLFGKERVLVLAMEMLRSDAADFVDRVIRFGGGRNPGPIPKEAVRRGFGALSLELNRLANLSYRRDPAHPRPSIQRLIRKATYRIDQVVPESWHRPLERRLQATVENAIGDRYRESNLITASITGLPLAELGYPT